MGCLPVLCWSYSWLSKAHPDPKGEQLGWVIPILKLMLDDFDRFNGAAAPGMGPGYTIGVMQDFISYPQWPRNVEEKARFSRGLKTELNNWYSHPYTPVLVMNRLAFEAPVHTNRRPYEERGWCHVELRLSMLVKHQRSCWYLGSSDTAYKDLESVVDLQDALKKARMPPQSPDKVSQELRDGVRDGKLHFTTGSDCELVSELYRNAFVTAFDKFHTIDDVYIMYEGLDWDDSMVPDIVESLEYIKKHCSGRADGQKQEIALYNNKFSGDCEELLQKVLEDSKLFGVIV